MRLSFYRRFLCADRSNAYLLQCNFTKGALIVALETLKVEPPTPLPHRWPFKHETDYTYLQELVRTKPSKYICPLMPFPLFDPANVFPATFGPDMQQANFLIDTSVTYLSTLNILRFSIPIPSFGIDVTVFCDNHPLRSCSDPPFCASSMNVSFRPKPPSIPLLASVFHN